MTRRHITLLALTALTAAAVCQAQPGIEARRYRGSDGVEIITSRGATASAAALSLPTSASAAKPPRAAAAGAEPGSTAAPAQVPGALQRQRDEERAQILWAELSQATQSWQMAQRALQSPRASAELSAAQRQDLAASVERYAQDIRALHAELRRLRPELQRQPRPS